MKPIRLHVACITACNFKDAGPFSANQKSLMMQGSMQGDVAPAAAREKNADPPAPPPPPAPRSRPIRPGAHANTQSDSTVNAHDFGLNALSASIMDTHVCGLDCFRPRSSSQLPPRASSLASSLALVASPLVGSEALHCSTGLVVSIGLEVSP